MRQVVERFLDQVARRRASYVALVLGQGAVAQAAGGDAVASVREHVAGVVAVATGLPDAVLPAVHGWVAYLEDRALQGPLPVSERDAGRAALVDHCTRALGLLTAPA